MLAQRNRRDDWIVPSTTATGEACTRPFEVDWTIGSYRQPPCTQPCEIDGTIGSYRRPRHCETPRCSFEYDVSGVWVVGVYRLSIFIDFYRFLSFFIVFIVFYRFLSFLSIFFQLSPRNRENKLGAAMESGIPLVNEKKTIKNDKKR